MGTFMDVLISTIFGGVLLVITLNANDIAAETQMTCSGDMLVQEMLVSTAQIIEGEFRNMGFGVPENEATIISADSTSIAFLCDLSRSGDRIDTIQYSLGSTSELSSTQNELDRYLNRRVNGESMLHVGTVTAFDLHYYTRGGEEIPAPVRTDRLSEIHVVEVTMEVQNPYAPLRDKNQVQPGERTALFSSSLWQQTRLASQNSRR